VELLGHVIFFDDGRLSIIPLYCSGKVVRDGRADELRRQQSVCPTEEKRLDGRRYIDEWLDVGQSQQESARVPQPNNSVVAASLYRLLDSGKRETVAVEFTTLQSTAPM
jgi:hypothetical protein